MSKQPIMRASSRFDRRITLRQVVAQRVRGRVIGSTDQDVTLWAQVIENVGAEQRADGSFSQPRIRLEVNIRHRDDVLPDQQVVYNGAVYNITGIAEIGRNKVLRLACVLATGETCDA